MIETTKEQQKLLPPPAVRTLHLLPSIQSLGIKRRWVLSR
jgi:hypothetical protein